MPTILTSAYRRRWLVILQGLLEKNDRQLCDRLLSNALAILTVAGTIALCGLGIVAWQLPHLFRSVPSGLAGELSSGILILGLSAAIGLPSRPTPAF